MDEPTYIEGFHNKLEVVKMTYKPLRNTGLRLSHMSLGGGPIGGIYEHLEEEEAISLIHEAIRKGINYIDTAPFYGQGQSECIIGKALKSIPRKAYYVGTKVGRYAAQGKGMFDFSARKTESSVENSLRLLGLSYVDILQVHDVEFAENLDQIVSETLPTLQKLVEKGQARFIGVTGYPLGVLKELSEKSTVKIDCILTYSRNTLIDNELEKYVPYFQSKNIGIIDAAVIAMGLLTNDTTPPIWHPTSKEIRDACEKAASYCKDHDTDISQLAIQHSKSQEGITTHLIGSGKLQVFRKNWDYFTTAKTEKQIQLTNYIIERFFLPLKTKHWENENADRIEQLRLRILMRHEDSYLGLFK